MTRTIHIQYFAVLREQARRGQETRQTTATTPAELYEEARAEHGFTLPRAMLRVAVNDEFCDWSSALQPGDNVVFIPPVAGG
jgi:molybdopterin synthase sulfur carrier subunit